MTLRLSFHPTANSRESADASSSQSVERRTGLPGAREADARGAGTLEEARPFFAAAVMVQDYATSASSGTTVKLHVQDALVTQAIHPMKGIRCAHGRDGIAHAQRLHVVLGAPGGEQAVEAPVTTLYDGEGYLLSWGDDSRMGMRFALRLESHDGPHPLTGIQAHRTAGEVIFATIWALSDEERHTLPRKSHKSFAELTPVKQSQIICRHDRQFQRWTRLVAPTMLETGHLPEDGDDDIRFAEAFVRSFCGVESRSEFNQDTRAGYHAREAWRHLLRQYERYQRP